MSSARELLTLLLCLLCLITLAQAKPTISSFSMDMHYGLITLSFSDTMMSKTFDATKLTLQNTKSYYNCTGSQTREAGNCPVSSGAYRLRISENRFTRIYNATSLYVSLSPSDYSALLLEPTIAKGLGSSFITMDVNTTRATTMEYAKAIQDGNARQATTYKADALSPSFKSWTMNMDTGIMNLTFAEPVNGSTFVASSLSFQAASNLGIDTSANALALSTTNVTVLSEPAETVSVDVGLYNLNRIKALYPLGTESSLLYLSLSAPCIKDIAGNDNSLAYLSIYEGKEPVNFVPDGTIPVLDHYDLDMNAGTLTLYFSETINAFQLNIEVVTLQEKASRGAGTYKELTSASTKASTDPSPVVTINLGAEDMHAIKLLDMNVASEGSKTYMTFPSSFTRDMSVSPHFEVAPLVDGVSSMNVYRFTPDTTSPALLNYELDMNARQLILNFNEPVRSNTLLVTYFTFQDDADVATNGGNKVALTPGSTTSSPNGLQIVIDICDLDFNSLKVRVPLLLSKAFLNSGPLSLSVGPLRL